MQQSAMIARADSACGTDKRGQTIISVLKYKNMKLLKSIGWINFKCLPKYQAHQS